MADSAAPNLCPLCGYSLAGLPANHRCPECGFAYDEHTHVWRVPALRFKILEFFGPIACIVIMVVALWPYFYHGTGRLMHLAFVAGILTCFGLIIRAIRRRADAEVRGICVAITPRGLFVRDEQGEEWIAWNELGRIVISPGFQYATRLNSIRTTALPMALGENETPEDFIKRIEAARAHYLQAASATPPGATFPTNESAESPGN